MATGLLDKVPVKTGHTVTSVTYDNNKYIVNYVNSAGERGTQGFDYVVVATPLPSSGIDLSRVATQEEIKQADNFDYQHVHTTLVKGKLNPVYFSMKETDSDFIN